MLALRFKLFWYAYDKFKCHRFKGKPPVKASLRKGKKNAKFFYLQYRPLKIFLLCLAVFRRCHPLKSRQKTSTLLTSDTYD